MVTSASSKSTACECRNRARNKFFSDEEGSRGWRHSRKDRERKILERLSSVDTERRRGSAGGLDLIRSVLLLAPWVARCTVLAKGNKKVAKWFHKHD